MMKNIDVKRKSLGVNFENGSASIKVWAPKAESVVLKLVEKGRIIPLQQDEFGCWTGKSKEIEPGDLYKFVLDDEKELPDPTSVSQPEGVHGASRALDFTSYSWEAKQWNNLSVEDYIIYELHTGTFSASCNFEGIENKLDYLKELGVNAIEIMPVAHFPGNRNWGYDGVHLFAVHTGYGGAEGLQHLVDTCHKRGIAVILDVVYNHLGPEGNYLSQFGHYFTDKYKTPWGDAVNFDDSWCDQVREFFIENVLMWFRDFRIDALRLDALHAIKDFSPTHILREMKQKVNELMFETGRTHCLIAEVDLNDSRFINPLNEDGYGMDAQWIDEFHHSLRVTAGEARRGYYADFEGIAHLAKSYEEAYVYNGIYSPHRKKTFGTRTDGNPGKQFVVFSQNHDQVGNRMLGERTSGLVSVEMQKLMAGAVFASPFVPLLFMGEEYGETNPFQYFVSHTDPDLVEAVRQGRKAEFPDFQGEEEAPDPQSEETFQRSKLQWNLPEKEPHKSLFDYYQKLISLRKSLSPLKNLDRKNLEVTVDEGNKTLVIHRWHEDDYVVCLLNFSKEPCSVKIPNVADEWQKLIHSADPEWKGSQEAPETISGGSDFIIAPESFSIYSNNA